MLLIDKEDKEDYGRLIGTIAEEYYKLALDEREYCLYIKEK